MKRSSIPNLITFVRILMVLPLLWMMLNEWWTAAFAVFLVAGLSDGLDGYLARRFGWSSRLGGFLDPVADKLLMTVVYVCLGVKGVVPMYLSVLVISRDVVIMSGAAAYYALHGPFQAAARWTSKFNTVVQIAVVVVALASVSVLKSVDGLLFPLVALCVVTTVVSGLEYVVVWSMKAVRKRKST